MLCHDLHLDLHLILNCGSVSVAFNVVKLLVVKCEEVVSSDELINLVLTSAVILACARLYLESYCLASYF